MVVVLCVAKALKILGTPSLTVMAQSWFGIFRLEDLLSWMVGLWTLLMWLSM